MDQTIYLVTLVATALVLAAAFSSLIAFRFGAPLLLLFLGIGLVTGVDGLGIPFDNARLAYFAGSLALAIILFDSGFGTPLNVLRQAALPAISLATAGVVLTTLIFGAAAFYLTQLTWLESFLLGAAVASTDAAAVFFLLRAGNLSLRDRVRSTLEIESGTNDPIAIFLTITLVEVIALGADPEAQVLLFDIVIGFIEHMGLGAIAGVLGGMAIVRLVDRLNLDSGLLPIFVLTLSLLVFAAAGAIGGSGFLAVYLAGLVAGNSQIRATNTLKRFQDGMSWLAQIIMFLVLGLFATPSQFPAILVPAVLLGLFLVFIARPIAVSLCLFPFRFPRAETAFISWVGLRGAVSILLALTPLIGGLENGRLIFNIAFIVVLVSLVVQGWTVGPAGAAAGVDRAGQARPARQGRARTSRLRASRVAGLYGGARQPGCARAANSALGAAIAGGARRAFDAFPGYGTAGGGRPCLHLRARPLSAPARPAVRQSHRGRSRGRGFLRRLCGRSEPPRVRSRSRLWYRPDRSRTEDDDIGPVRTSGSAAAPNMPTGSRSARSN